MTDPTPPDAKCSQEWGTNELRRMVDSVAHIQSPLSTMVYAAAAELEDLRPRLAASRRNEVLRAQERDEAIASGKVLVEANLRHFNTATENHNRAEALWNELVEVAAQAKEWERRFNWKADASNTELASVTAERDALREDMKTVAERQREACAKAIERNWAYPISKVRCTPLVTDVPAAEREAEEEPPWAEDTRKVNEAVARRAAAMPGRCIHCGCTFETGQHQGYDMDHEFEPAVAMAREAIREENAELDEPDEDHICVRQDVRIRELESQLEGRKARIRELENLLKAIMVERDDAVEHSKSTVREGQAESSGIISPTPGLETVKRDPVVPMTPRTRSWDR